MSNPKGPKVNWDYLKKMHPILPVIKAVSSHMEGMFKTWTRYKAHTTPHDVKGIRTLQQSYSAAQLYTNRPGRKLAAESRVSDYIDEGLGKLSTVLEKWVDGRSYERSHENSWSEPESDLIEFD